MAWNLERGLAFARQRDLLLHDPDLAHADVYLLPEADHGCTRTGGRHVARELAEALGCAWAFAAQYVELPRRARRARDRVDGPCLHGPAVLSRWPVVAARELRHPRAASWRASRREPRVGGAVTVVCDLDVAGAPLRACAVHLDSRLSGRPLRRAQAHDLALDAGSAPGPVVLGGDFNCYAYGLDLWLGTRLDATLPPLRAAGLRDAHAGLPPWRRATTDRSHGVRGVIDLVLARGLVVEAAGVVPPRRAGGLSDHLPVWARFAWPPA